MVGLAPGQTLPLDEFRNRGYDVTPLGERCELRLSETQNIDPIIDLIRARGLSLRYLVEKRQTLEDMFVETLEKEKSTFKNEGRTPDGERNTSP